MAKQGITTGTSPNDGTGDTLLAGAVKINDNFLSADKVCIEELSLFFKIRTK